MKNLKVIIIIFISLGLLAFIKWRFLSNPESQNPVGKMGMMNSPVDVTAYVVKPEKSENKLFVTGTTLASEEAELMAEISGKITNLNLKEGSAVQKGELLVKINDADLQAQLKKLKSQEELAKQKENRIKTLLDINGISKEEYETAQNNLNSIRADIEVTQAQIAKTEIRAPFSGTVGLKNISEGSYVTPSVIIAAIQQADPVKIDFSVSEKYASLIREGGAIRFFTEGADEAHEAKIIAVEPKIDIATRTVKARAICQNKQRKIIPGSFAKVELVLKESENSLMIPTEALLPILKGYKIFVCRNGKAEEVIVAAGLRTENRIRIIQGLQPGDTVITTGIMQLKNGMPVKIVLQ